jgi:membrane protein YdbS with pleckstrin-like domain
MNGSPPKSIDWLIRFLLFAAVVIVVIIFIFVLAVGPPPLWALGILFAVLIALVIVRLIGLAGFGYPRYDFSKLYAQNKEGKEKK